MLIKREINPVMSAVYGRDMSGTGWKQRGDQGDVTVAIILQRDYKRNGLVYGLR